MFDAVSTRLRLIAAGSLVGLVMVACVPLPKANLLTNSSFEGSTVGWIGIQATVSDRPDANVPNGLDVAYVDGSPSARGYFGLVQLSPVLQAGKAYRAEAYVAGIPSPVAGVQHAHLWIVSEAGPERIIGEASVDLVPGQYQHLSVTAITTSSQVNVAVVQDPGSGPQALLVDAVTLAPVN